MTKFQKPKSVQGFGYWVLDIGVYLVIGAWDLVILAFH